MVTTPKTISIHCNNCNHLTNHRILHEYRERDTYVEWVDGTNPIELWTDIHVQILKCGSCGEFALRKYDIWCEDRPDQPDINVIILPKRGNASIKSADTFIGVPDHIISLYKEIVAAFTDDIDLLCAGGIRAILEAICTDKGIKGGTPTQEPKYTTSLKGKIYGLFENGYLTSKHSEILIHHQYLGDKALHELEKPSHEELEIAIGIIAITLSSVYELLVKGDELKNKKDKRKNI